MARGKKSKPSFDDQIAKIDEKIGALKEKLSALNKERADLFAQKESSELAELNAVLKEAGKSPADILAMLK